ncbi:MAG: DUF4340 domain-containing protein [Myxococcota bacterium]|nr:DUF4340 domain-containing protein [Myxococcota bacterium]
MTQRNLGILLVAQLVLVAMTWWPSDPSASRRPLFDFDRDAFERIEIATGSAASDPAVLVKEGGTWKVHSAADYPATPAKIEALLDTLLGLEVGPAIAGQSQSHEPLNVGDDSYGRRVSVTAAGEVSDWLVGAATSRSVNVRRVGDDEVYPVRGASEWSFQHDSASYFDTTYLDANPASFGAVVLRNENGETRFEQSAGVWTLADLVAGESADSDAIATFLSSVARLRMTEPVAAEALPEHGLENGSRIDWTLVAEDQSIAGGYRLGSEIDGDRFVQATGDTFVVRARASDFEDFLSATRSRFLR